MPEVKRKPVTLMACLLTGVLFTQPLAAQPEFEPDTQPFSHAWLQAHARDLAQRDPMSEGLADDSSLQALSYDDYQRIVFDPESAVWAEEGRPFQLQLFHPGFLHTTPVRLHVVSDGQARRLAFTTDVFDYRSDSINTDELDAAGYAGFRIHHPINTTERFEEFLVFLGASYFRAVGQDQFYGLSARGLAVNTVGDGGEEFPRFSDFWIERPESDSDDMVVHALLDSQSVTGAYQFTISPGAVTRVDVEASLYPRRDMEHVGIAPLTSMFFFDMTNRGGVDDYRNAVHDSNGLYILQADGERIWRPLANPARVQVSSFGATPEMPAGFGLLQRRQGFDQYNDDEARYDKRPSLWIEPMDDWGDGQVELVEIPTGDEYHDNIVAFWQPAGGLEAGEEYHFQYRMHWGEDSPFARDQGRVTNTASGPELGSEERLFVIDYRAGSRMADVASDPEAVAIHATTSAGEITHASGTLLDATGDYRVYVRLDTQGISLAELRVTLNVDGSQWGETWLYRWTQ